MTLSCMRFFFTDKCGSAMTKCDRLTTTCLATLQCSKLTVSPVLISLIALDGHVPRANIATLSEPLFGGGDNVVSPQIGPFAGLQICT